MSTLPPPSSPPPTSPSPTSMLGKRRSAGLVVLLTIVTCGIWAVVWAYQNGDELQRFSGKGAGGVVHLIVTLLLSPVTMFLLAGEVEQLYRDDGQEPPITAIWGLWFLLPLIGNLIWYLRIQDAINTYWTAHGQTNDPGL